MFPLQRAVQAAPRQAARRACAASNAAWQQTPAQRTRSYATSKDTSDEAPAATTKATTETKDADSTKPSTRAPRPSPFTSKASPKSNPRPTAAAQHNAAFHYPNQAEGSPAVQEIDWTTSYYGLGVAPVTKEQAATLARPLATTDIEVKPDGIIYLPEIKYRRRLNEVFGPMGWGLAPRGEAIVGSTIVTREYALVAQGRFVAQAQGENAYFSPDQLPSSVEGTKSNALMRCCKDLGIGSELWDPEFIRKFKKSEMQEVWVEHATTKKKRTLWYKKGAVEVVYPWKKVK